MTLLWLLVACGPGRADVAPGSIPLTAPWSTYDLPLYGAEVRRSDAENLDIYYVGDHDVKRCAAWVEAFDERLGAPISAIDRPGGGTMVDWKQASGPITTLSCDTAEDRIRVSIDIISAEPTP